MLARSITSKILKITKSSRNVWYLFMLLSAVSSLFARNSSKQECSRSRAMQRLQIKPYRTPSWEKGKSDKPRSVQSVGILEKIQSELLSH